MNRFEAERRLKVYLKSHFINYTYDIDNGVPRYTLVSYGYDSAPNKAIETCIWLYSEECEVRSYYAQNAAEWCNERKEQLPRLMMLLNYINAVVWMSSSDGINGVLYQPHYLYTARFYITEDNCYDITMTTVIPYDVYELAPLETEDYITAFCPELLAKLAPAIYGLLFGIVDIESAKQYIRVNVLEKKDECSYD